MEQSFDISKPCYYFFTNIKTPRSGKRQVLQRKKAMSDVSNLWKGRAVRVLSAFFIALCMVSSAEAGDWWVFLGAGGGNGESVTGDVGLRRTFSPLYENDAMALSPLAEVSASVWRHDADDEIWSGGASVGLLLVFYREGCWRPYASATVGGVVLSGDRFGTHDMGGRFQFRSKGVLGVQFGEDFRHSLQLDAAHISNAGIYGSNSGFNVFGVSYGFRF